MSSKGKASKKTTLPEKDDLNVEEIHMNLVRFIVGCGLAFSIVDNDLFKHFVESINKDYSKKIPSRKTVSTRLLDKLHNEILEETRSKAPKEVCLLADSWKNSAGKHQNFAIMMHNADGYAHFMDSHDMTGTSETSVTLADSIYKTINDCKEKFNTKPYALVTDNAANMVSVGKLVSHTLWFSRCMSHVGNLLTKDVICAKTKDKISEVQNYFRSTTFSKLLSEEGAKRPITPSNIRWCFLRDTFKNFEENLQAYKRISLRMKLDKQIVSTLNDNALMQKARNQLEMLDPICSVINICQGMHANISDGAEAWLRLTFPSSCTSQQTSKLKNRKLMALTNLALAGFYLDPFKDKNLLTNNQKSAARSFISGKLREDLRDQFIQYENDKDIFSDIRQSTKSAIDYWSYAHAFFPELSNLAMKLLKIPASTAQLERSFSMWQHIHSKLRNRLTFDRSRKLIECYYFFAVNKCYEPQVILDGSH